MSVHLRQCTFLRFSPALQLDRLVRLDVHVEPVRSCPLQEWQGEVSCGEHSRLHQH